MIPIALLVLFFGGFLLFFRGITKRRTHQLAELASQRATVEGKYRVMVDQKKILKAELEEKERALSTLRANLDGLKTISASDLDISDIDENEKISRYLIQEGKITLEQNEKVLNQMANIQMDYIGVCLTLGYIDLETAKKAAKVTKTKTNSIHA